VLLNIEADKTLLHSAYNTYIPPLSVYRDRGYNLLPW